MLKHRVIPALLLQNGGLVKTRQFKQPKYVGDPTNAIRIFNEKEVDELMVLDIAASRRGSEPDFASVKDFADECFMPLCYGGGIRTLNHAARLFDLGVEKLSVQTAALEDLGLVRQIATRYGSQSVVLSVDVIRNWRGKPELYAAAQEKSLGSAWLEFANAAVDAGAGEVLLNAVHRDGTLEGPDLELIGAASTALSVPLIALGGVGSLEDIRAAVDAGASAVAAGAFFVFHGPNRAVLITYPRYTTLESLFRD